MFSDQFFYSDFLFKRVSTLLCHRSCITRRNEVWMALSDWWNVSWPRYPSPGIVVMLNNTRRAVACACCDVIPVKQYSALIGWRVRAVTSLAFITNTIDTSCQTHSVVNYHLINVNYEWIVRVTNGWQQKQWKQKEMPIKITCNFEEPWALWANLY